MVRLAHRLGLLTTRQRACFAGVSDGIGRLLLGWAKSVRPR